MIKRRPDSETKIEPLTVYNDCIWRIVLYIDMCLYTYNLGFIYDIHAFNAMWALWTWSYTETAHLFVQQIQQLLLKIVYYRDMDNCMGELEVDE